MACRLHEGCGPRGQGGLRTSAAKVVAIVSAFNGHSARTCVRHDDRQATRRRSARKATLLREAATKIADGQPMGTNVTAWRNDAQGRAAHPGRDAQS